MTGSAPASRLMPSSIARGLGLALVSATFLVTGATAQQGWEPTVLVGAIPPKPMVQPQGKTALQKPKRAGIAEVVEKNTQPPLLGPGFTETSRNAASPGPSGIETGSTKAPRAEEYCANIIDPAADARFAWQKKVLADMEQEIAKRIALLEEKTVEYQKWLARRDEFSQKANETLLSIYTRMRPDAAAAQLAALDEETAAALLTKLQPRTASLILNEMEAAQAVRLAATISGAGKVSPSTARRTAAEAK